MDSDVTHVFSPADDHGDLTYYHIVIYFENKMGAVNRFVGFGVGSVAIYFALKSLDNFLYIFDERYAGVCF
jgi:hypothetical protein